MDQVVNFDDENRTKVNNVSFRLPDTTAYSNRQRHERETPAKSTEKEKAKLTK
jgi:hypothetical protein